MHPRFHVIDFEGHPSYGVIEYGIVTVEDVTITATATRLCAPTGGIPARDSAVHGLLARDITAHAPFADDYARFVDWRRSGQFVAHNKTVEHNLLKHTWPFPPAVPDWDNQLAPTADWGPWVDTVAVAQAVWPEAERFALGALVEHLALHDPLDALAARHCPPDRRKAHCALYDALASALILAKAIKMGWEKTDNRAQGELF